MLVAACGVAIAQDAAGDDVSKLVREFIAAEQAYDAAALSRLISDQYVEVSPAGEVDAHDRFLSFYAPEKRVPWPPMTTSGEQVRVFGDTAVEIVTFHYQMPGANGQSRTMEIRGSFVAQKSGAGWKLIGAQYTGIRQAAPATH